MFMKKVFLFIAIAVVGKTVYAQTSVSLHGNILSSKISETYSEDEGVPMKSRIGYKGGVTANFPVSGTFSIMPQLSYVSKGAKVDFSETIDLLGMSYSYTAKGFMRMSYLELPVHFVYNKEMVNGKKFFLGVGPSVSLGLGGKGKLHLIENFDGDKEETNFDIKVKFDGKENTDDELAVEHYKRTELGLSVIGGLQLNDKLSVNLQFNQGISNINTSKNSKDKTRTYYFGLGLGFSLF
jgi:hypothetical protein